MKITTTKQTNMMETEPLTKGIVIFGATGDLCKKKLIPALYKLWKKDLAAKRILLLLEAARERTYYAEMWKEVSWRLSRGFLYHLDYVSCDLWICQESLMNLP